MDTRREIVRDEWMQKHLGCCGTCRFWQLEGIDKGCVCVNTESEHLYDWREAEDGCDQWLCKREVHIL